MRIELECTKGSEAACNDCLDDIARYADLSGWLIDIAERKSKLQPLNVYLFVGIDAIKFMTFGECCLDWKGVAAKLSRLPKDRTHLPNDTIRIRYDAVERDLIITIPESKQSEEELLEVSCKTEDVVV